MKKLILIFLFASTLITVGQNEQRNMKLAANFTPEQQAILKTKEMAIHLDLNASQQSQILTLNKKWIQKTTAKKEAYKDLNKEDMSSDQKFEMMNKALDNRLAHQEEIKKILNKEQYETWKESSRKMYQRAKIKRTQVHRKGQKGKN